MTETDHRDFQHEARILILTPTGRDAEMTASFLRNAGFDVEICRDTKALCAGISEGAGVAFLTGEALTPQALRLLLDELWKQPQWSDIPLVVLTSGGGGLPANDEALKTLGEKGNVTLIERPVRSATLLSAVGSALRARYRQYDVRDHLREEARSREALAQSEQRLRIALDAAQLGAWELALPAFSMTCTSSCKANFGLPPEAHFGYDTLMASIHPEDRETMRLAVINALQERSLYRHEYRVVWPDGSVHWILASGRANYDSSGEPQGMIGVTLDITERRNAEQERERLLILEQTARTEAEAASRLKDEFLATVSHELRTPLTAILGWAHMLRGDDVDKEVIGMGLETIERNARAQAQLIDDLLDVSRIITGKLRLEMKPVDLEEIVTATVNAVRPSAEAKSINLHISLLKGASISGDTDRLQQVVWNLLTNAVKFTPENGVIEVQLRPVESSFEICVTDNGAGIEPDFLVAVFDRFRQADQTSTRHYGGLGLGLSIVRQLVELHGGSVRAESEGKGKGASFIVRLPQGRLHPEEDEGEPLRETPGYSSSSGSSASGHQRLKDLRILVVDDEPDTRTLLTAMLGKIGAEVKTAHSAAEALKVLQKWNPQILVSDIGMPGEDGYSLIGKIRSLENSNGSSLPAIALTAYARERDREQALQAGFQAHIAKPINHDLLVSVVAELTGRS